MGRRFLDAFCKSTQTTFHTHSFVPSKLPVFADMSGIIWGWMPLPVVCSAETHKSTISFIPEGNQQIFFEWFHEQLPLPVPCYDLVFVIEFAFVHNEYFLWITSRDDLTNQSFRVDDLVFVIEFALNDREDRLRALPTSLTWRAVSTKLENVFTAVWLTRDY